jgi:branched-chain amino acid transport system substrate-binding protein
MKRTFNLLSLFVLLGALLAACGAQPPAAEAPAAPAATEAPAAAAPTEAPAAAPTEAPAASGGEQTLIKIASLLPRTGTSKGQSDTMVNAIKQRFEEANYEACGGQFKIEYVDLDDATAAKGAWDEAQVASNANKISADSEFVAAIGHFNSGAAKISIPILNQANMLLITPANTYPGLTKTAGAAEGEPEKYYPNGTRNYLRIPPADDIQGAVGARWAQSLGATTVYILDDAELYGKGIADVFNATATEIGLDVQGQESIDGKASDYRAIAAKIVDLNPDAVYFGGVTPNGVGQLWKDIRGEGYEGILMGADGIYETAFIESAGADIAEGTYVTFAGKPNDQLTGKGKQWYEGYKAAYNSEPEAYAVYSYEAASIVLHAIEQVCQADRAAIRDAAFAVRDWDGVLGTWSFNEEGDTNLTAMSGFQVQDSGWNFVGLLE